MTAPNAPLLTAPIGATVIDRAVTQRFAWAFSDPDPGDSQSAYGLRYRLVGAPSWTDTSATTASTFRDIAGGTLAAGDHEWQVRCTDALGAVGPYSASAFFTAANVPATPAITAPADGSTVIATAPVTWTAASQDYYQVRSVADVSLIPYPSIVYSDTGEVASIAARSVDFTFPANGRYEHVQVRVKAGGLWSPWASVRVHASYPSLQPGTLAVAAEQATASLLVTTALGAPVPGAPAAQTIDIYLRDPDEAGFGSRYAGGLPPVSTWRWWTPRSGVDYDVRTLTHGADGSTAWSPRVFALIYDGGVAAGSAWVFTLDAGTPSTLFADAVDGGSP